MDTNFIDLTIKIIKNYKLIIKLTSIFILIGIFIAFISPNVYTAKITIVPQTSNSKSLNGSNLAGLAAVAGLNLNDIGSNEVLSPTVYPQIINSVHFLKDLMYCQYHIEDSSQPVSLFEFYNDKKYHKNKFIFLIKKYTIGLLGHLKKYNNDYSNYDKSLININRKEYDVIRKLRNSIDLSVNIKNGYISISTRMPEAILSAELAQNIEKLLQVYLKEFKSEKARTNLAFIQLMYNEAKLNYENKNKSLAIFVDNNQNTISAVAKIQEEMLRNDYNLAYNVYSELAKQLDQAKIKVEEDSPVLTVIEPAVIPVERAQPQRSLIVISFLFLGFFLSICVLFTLPYLTKVTNNNKWNSIIIN